MRYSAGNSSQTRRNTLGASWTVNKLARTQNARVRRLTLEFLFGGDESGAPNLLWAISVCVDA
jgi:hypothetical protein